MIGMPQAIMIVLILIGVGVSVARFGQQKKDTYDWVDVLVGPLLMLGLLYWGGFFGA